MNIETSESTAFNRLIKEMFQCLADVCQQAGENEYLEANLERIFDSILSLHDYNAVWILIKQSETGETVLHSYKGLSPEMVEAERCRDPEKCLAEFVFRTGQVIALKDLEQCQCMSGSSRDSGVGIQSHLSLPIKDEGRTIGILNVGSANKRKYHLPEIQFFAVISGLISLLFRMNRSRRSLDAYKDHAPDIGLQHLFEKIVDGILLMERDFKVTMINPAGKPFLAGFSEFEKGDFLGKLSELEQSILDELMQGGKEVLEREIPLSLPAGKILRLTATPIKNAAGQIESVLMVVKDVTDEKAIARKEKIQTRVSSVSSLLEGITHELNNPLAAVSGYLQILQIKYSSDQGIADLMSKMERELNRAIVIVRNLVALAEKKPIEKIPVQIAKLMEKVISESQSVPGRSLVKINLTVDPDIPILYLEADNMKQVLRNIIEDAAQKIMDRSGGGTLQIVLQQKQDVVQIILEGMGTELFSKNVHEVSGTDELSQVTEQDMEISLAFCSMVVKNHDGVIYAETGSGQGTGFVIELPVFPEELK